MKKTKAATAKANAKGGKPTAKGDNKAAAVPKANAKGGKAAAAVHNPNAKGGQGNKDGANKEGRENGSGGGNR